MTCRVLVVDDNPDIRLLLTHALSEECEVDPPLASLHDARRVLDADPRYEVVLTDLLLPDGWGVELVVEYGNRLPVIVMTGYADPVAEKAVMEAGAYAFVSKPFDMKRLVRLVQEAAHHGEGEHHAGT